MPFNYGEFYRFIEKEDFNTITGLEVAIIRWGSDFFKKDLVDVNLPRISYSRLLYWFQIGCVFSDLKPKDFKINGDVSLEILAKKRDINLKDILKLREVAGPPTIAEIDLLYAFAKSRGHTDFEFYTPPKSTIFKKLHNNFP